MKALILAGGQASRLGGVDKGSFAIAGRSIIDRIVDALEPQCDGIIVSGSAGSLGSRYVVIPDGVLAHSGPLAGVVSGLDYIASLSLDITHLMTVPTDTPFLPTDLASRLQAQLIRERAEIVCARSNGNDHPTVALWSVALRHALRATLVEDGVRRLRAAMRSHRLTFCDWSTEPLDPFFNVNTPDDRDRAELLAATADDAAKAARPR